MVKDEFDHRIASKPVLFAKFPQRSAMNSNQHQACLNALATMTNVTASMSDRSDVRTYAQLSIERHKEKTNFLQFVKDEFYQRNIKNCQNLQPELEKFVTRRWKDSIKRLVTTNTSCYQLQSAIPICPSSNSNDEYTIEYEKTLKQTGVVLTVNCKKYSNPIQVSCSYLEYFFSTDVALPLDESHPQNESADVVISVATLTAILISAQERSRTDWNITFTLTESDNHKTIRFDELLPAVSLRCLDKNRLAYKYGVTAAIAVAKKKTVFSFEENAFIERTQPTFDNCGTSVQQQSESAADYKVWNFEEYLHKCRASISTNNSNTADRNHIRRRWNVKRNSVDYCRLVVDSSQDFCEKQSDGSVRFINLSPKLEYQCEFGAEQMSLSELITEWCRLRFGHNTTTHRGICCHFQ